MKKYETIMVNDKEYKIRFSMNNIIQLEEMLGKGIADVTGGSLSEVRAMIYCTITPKFENVEEAGEWMDDILAENSMDYLIEHLTKAMELGMGKQKKSRQKVQVKK